MTYQGFHVFLIQFDVGGEDVHQLSQQVLFSED